MIIYLVRNKVNGKGYVGQTIKTFEKRWTQHLSDARNERYANIILHKAIRKYGDDAFEHTILAETDNLPELYLLEIEQIAKQGTKVPNGYNMTDGGD